MRLYFPAYLVVVALQLLMKTLVALLHLLLVTDQRCQAVQRTGVQIISVTPHNSTQRLRLTNHLRPRLIHTDGEGGVVIKMISTNQVHLQAKNRRGRSTINTNHKF